MSIFYAIKNQTESLRLRNMTIFPPSKSVDVHMLNKEKAKDFDS